MFAKGALSYTKAQACQLTTARTKPAVPFQLIGRNFPGPIYYRKKHGIGIPSIVYENNAKAFQAAGKWLEQNFRKKKYLTTY